MTKRCIVCNAGAEFRIKDTSDFYCQDCAEENFADLTMLINVEEEAQRFRQVLQSRMESSQQEVKNDQNLEN